MIERVKRNESGNYACVSVANSANQTSAITTVDVLCEYRYPKMYPGLGGVDYKQQKQKPKQTVYHSPYSSYSIPLLLLFHFP